MKALHDTQLQILKKLLFAKSLHYLELKPDPEMENNKFDFHLDQMIAAGFIQKSEDGYSLTHAGKEYANRIDTDRVEITKQAKISVFVAPVRIIDDKWEFLVYTRMKQPFYGCQGFLSGKVRFGDKVLETAVRELKEETNLEGQPQIVSLHHYRVYDRTSQQLVEDKFMFLCLVINPTGELIPNNEGKYEWVKEDLVFDYVTNHFESLDQFKEDVATLKNFTGQISFHEIDHLTDKF